jgi:hypothetical protein
MKTQTKRVSVPRARQIWENHEKSLMRQHLRQLPPQVRYAVAELQRVSQAETLDDEPRWRGISLAVQNFAQREAAWGCDVGVLRYARKLLSEMASHPDLATRRDGGMCSLHLGVAHRYNALQRYVVVLENVVGKDADLDKAAR